MMNRKTLLILSVLVVVLLAAVPGFTGGQKEAPEKEGGKVPLTLFLWRPGDRNYSSEGSDMEIVSLIEEELGIDFNLNWVFSRELVQKKAMLIASGDIPDMFPAVSSAMGGKNELREFAEAGLLRPLDDLIETRGQNILDKVAPEKWDSVKINGKIYGIPGNKPWVQCNFVRKDFLEKLNINPDSLKNYTLDDLYDLLVRFRDEDPDGNGKNDTIPFAVRGDDAKWTYNTIAHAFGYSLFGLYDRGDMLLPGALFPEMKGAIEYMRKLYKEGLLDPEFALNTQKVYVQKIESGKVGFGFHDYVRLRKRHPTQLNLKNFIPGAELVAVEPPTGPGGKRAVMINDPEQGLVSWTISANCKYPEKAISFYNYIMSDDGYAFAAYGHKGPDWEKDEDGVVVTKFSVEDKVKRGIMAIHYIPQYGGVKHHNEDSNAQYALSLPETNTVDLGIRIYTPVKEAMENQARLKEMIAQFYINMIVSDEDLNAAFEKFSSQYLKNGGELVGKALYKAYK